MTWNATGGFTGELVMRMNLISLLDDKTIKPIEKRKSLEEAIKAGIFTIKEIQSLSALITV